MSLAWRVGARAFIGAMFAIPGRCRSSRSRRGWWLSRRARRTVRWRVHGEEYKTRRK